MSRYLGPLALVLFLGAGTIKASPVFSWFPIDMTVAAASLVLLIAAYDLAIRRVGVEHFGLGVLSALVTTFAIGLLHFETINSTYAQTKSIRLFALTFAASFAAAVIIRGRTQMIHSMLLCTAYFGLAIAGLQVLAPASASEFYGRDALEGSNTIAIARLTGVGVVALMALMQARKLSLLWGLIGCSALTVPIVGSGSRGPLIAVLVSVAVMFALAKTERKVIRFALIATVGAVVSSALWDRTNELARQRYLMLFSDDRGRSVTIREHLLDRGTAIALDHPLGLGWGNLAPQMGPYARYPHNILVEVAAEGGWVALLALVACWVIAWRNSIHQRKGLGGIAVFGMLTFWTINALVSGDVNDNRGFFIWVAIGLGLTAHQAKSELSKNSTSVRLSASNEKRSVKARRPAADISSYR